MGEIIRLTYAEYKKNGLPMPKRLLLDGVTKYVITDCNEQQAIEIKTLATGQIEFELN